MNSPLESVLQLNFVTKWTHAVLKAVFIVSNFPSLDMLKIVAYLQYGPNLLSSLPETSATILSMLFFAYIHLGSCLGGYIYSYGCFQPSYPTPTCQQIASFLD